MNCTVTPLHRLDDTDLVFIAANATRPKSDFWWKIINNELTEADGSIAVVRDQGEIVGWARSEEWHDEPWGEVWQTLEAFTREPWRRRGVCRYAVAGLLAAASVEPPVAIFRPQMIGLCRHLGLTFVEYEQGRCGWTRRR